MRGFKRDLRIWAKAEPRDGNALNATIGNATLYLLSSLENIKYAEHKVAELGRALASSIAYFGNSGPLIDAFVTILSAFQTVVKDVFSEISLNIGMPCA